MTVPAEPHAPVTADRLRRIRACLEQAFEPERLEIADESALHAGHPGARGGAGHFRLLLVSKRFRGRSMLERHRMVYEALAGLMGGEIHAVAISARTPEELSQ